MTSLGRKGRKEGRELKGGSAHTAKREGGGDHGGGRDKGKKGIIKHFLQNEIVRNHQKWKDTYIRGDCGAHTERGHQTLATSGCPWPQSEDATVGLHLRSSGRRRRRGQD